MNYENKYNEALEKARRKIENSRNIEMVSFIEDAFSELKESKDEKIRKELIKWMNDFPDMTWRCFNKEDIIAWLEKQSKNKPIERKEFTSIPFGTDSELIEEIIRIPKGYVATIEGQKVYIKKK